jgi:hypothetical protein
VQLHDVVGSEVGQFVERICNRNAEDYFGVARREEPAMETAVRR